MTALPNLIITGTASEVLGNLVGGSGLAETSLYGTPVTFVSNVPADHFVVWESRLEKVPPVVARFAPDGTLKRNGDLVKLLKNDSGLNVSGLQWTCHIPGMTEFTFNANSDVDLSSVVAVPSLPVVGTPFTEASIVALLANVSAPIRVALDALYQSGSAGSVTFAKLAAALVVTSSETITANNNDTTIPTSAAVAGYVATAVSTAVTNLVAGAPGALDTFIELATAIGNDPTFAADIQGQINAKYTKPGTGIPKTDLAAAVQTSLGLADTALQVIAVDDGNGVITYSGGVTDDGNGLLVFG